MWHSKVLGEWDAELQVGSASLEEKGQFFHSLEHFEGRTENKACYSCGEWKTVEDGMQGLGQASVWKGFVMCVCEWLRKHRKES